MSKVVYLETENNFSGWNQKIMDSDIMAAIYSPYEPTGHPSRVGEVWFQIPEGSEERKLRMWVAIAQHASSAKWEEILINSDELPEDLVRKNEENDFNNIHQTIGTRQIVTIIDGGENSLPNNTQPDFDGQIFFSYRNPGVPDAQGAAWIAKGNQWLPIAAAGNSGEGVYAELEKDQEFKGINHFTQPIRIGSPDNAQMAKVTTGRRTTYDPLSASSPDYIPHVAGDVLVRNNLSVGHDAYEVYVAGIEGDEDSWIKVYDSNISLDHLEAEITMVDGRVDTISERLDHEELELDDLAKRIGEVDLAQTGIESDIDLHETKLELLDERVRANEVKIAALETHLPTVKNSYEDRISYLEEMVLQLQKQLDTK